jgi:hypothetical protein
MKGFASHFVSISVAAIALSFVDPASAQGMLEQGKSLLGGSGSAAAIGGIGGQTSGIAGGLPLDKIMDMLKQQGYSNISGLMPSARGDALQASAVNSSGNPVSLLINPTTGKVISALMK